MLTWTQRLVFDYRPPDDHPPPPTPPAALWQATAPDGALLEAFRWGSPLSRVPYVLEVRRYGGTLAAHYELTETPELARRSFAEEYKAPAELPQLAELQSAADQLVPLGVVLALGVVSNGPEATYPSSAKFRAVRLVQAGAFEPGVRA